MILEQLYLPCLSQASYLLGDEASGTAVVVDPRRDVDVYLERAQALGLRIRHVYLTHFHADFVAGHLELAARAGADIRMGAKARAEFAHVAMADGDSQTIGNLRITVLETPGHTPEGVSLVVHDLARSADVPHAVLTGDTLFIGDTGRPDLMASAGAKAEDLAAQLHESVRRLMALPDTTLLYPGHGAGSACGKSLSKDTVSTIGAQRSANPMLRPMTREEFVAEAVCGLGAPPAYFAHDAQLNRRRRATLEEALERALRPLSVDELLRHRDAGGIVLDSRAADAFAPAHLAGSVNIGLDGKYAHWAGTMLDPRAAVAVVAEPGRERESAVRLLRVGFEGLCGVLAGGMDALRARPELLRAFERVDPGEAAALRGPRVLDVRTPAERADARIPGSLHIPLPELAGRLGEVDPRAEWTVCCGGGYRSTIACSLLEARGTARLVDVRGGMAAWLAAGLPAERGAVQPA